MSFKFLLNKSKKLNYFKNFMNLINLINFINLMNLINLSIITNTLRTFLLFRQVEILHL